MSFSDVLESQQRDEIDRLSEEIKERYDDPTAFGKGFLDPDQMELGEGWVQYHLFGTDSFDAWMREADKSAYLPEHVYPDNHLYLILLKGEVRTTVDGEPSLMNENNASAHFKPGSVLEMEAVEKSRMISIFRPPIAE
jgi:quercetin dioxygenase-like cupin family protein